MTGRGKNLTKIKELLNNPTKPKQELLMGGVNMIPRNRTMSMQSIPLDSVIPEPEVQKTTEDIDAENFLGSLVGQGFAMLGAGVAGRDPGRVADQFADMRLFSDRQKESQKQREEAIKQSQELMNPNSEISKRQRTLYSRFLGEIPSDVSASDLKDPVVLRGLQEQQIKLQAPKGGGVSQPKEEKAKEKKLSQDERQLLNNSALAYKALFDMENAIKNKISRRSFMGDNPYTYAANRFVEGIGRMQSGGAIGTEEAENFKRLIPGPYDDDDISKAKIKDMKLELESRLKSIGYSPKEILASRTYSEEEISPSEQDQAIKWANENINSKDEETRLKAEKILRGR